MCRLKNKPIYEHHSMCVYIGVCVSIIVVSCGTLFGAHALVSSIIAGVD